MIHVTKSRPVTLPGCRPVTKTLVSVSVGESTIPNAGLGVFLTQSQQKGALVAEYGGRVVGRSECEQLVQRGEDTHLRSVGLGYDALDGREIGDYTLREYYIKHDLLGSYVNDCWNTGRSANAEYWTYDRVGYEHPTGEVATGRVFVRLLCDLEAGEEILVSYGDQYWQRRVS